MDRARSLGLALSASALSLASSHCEAGELAGGGHTQLQIPLARPAPKLDDPRWNTAACASGFITADRSWPTAQTTALLQANGSKLYFAFQCQTPMPELQAKPRPDDTLDIFGDESVELFLQPEPDTNTYYHLAFNAVGSKYSARCSGTKRDTSWNPGLELQTGRLNQGWWLAGSIPLDSLGATPKNGDTWGLNCGRNQKTPEPVSSSWTGQSDFNAPKDFGRAVFANNGGLDFSLPELSANTMSLLLRNNSGKPLDVQVAVTSKGRRPTRTATVPPGGSSPLTFQGGFGGRTTLEISEPKAGTRIVRTAFLAPSAPQLIRLARYYCPPETRTLAGATIGDARHEISLSRGTGQPPLRRMMGVEGAGKAFSFDVADLEPGRYVVSSTARDASGKELATNSTIVFLKRRTAMPPLPKSQDFRLDGRRFVLNGQLFFPFMASPSSTASPLAKDCFNVKYGELGVRSNAPARGDCGLSGGRRKDGHFFYVLGPDGTIPKSPQTRGVLFRNLRYEAQFPLFREGPAGRLEPLDPPREYAKLFRRLKESSPETLVSIHTDKTDMAGEFAASGDIVEIAAWSSSYARDMLRNLANDIKSARGQVGDKPLIWWLGGSVPSAAAHDAAMVRGATYLAIMCQVNGIIFHLGHDGIPPEQTQLWSVFGGLAGEVETLYPLAQAAAPDPSVHVAADNAAIVCMATPQDGALHVVALNTTAEPVNAKLTFRQGAQGVVEVLCENRQLTPRDNAITDLFTGFEPHVYKVKPRN